MALEQSHSQSTAGYPIDDTNFQKMEIKLILEIYRWRKKSAMPYMDMAGNFLHQSLRYAAMEVGTNCSKSARDCYSCRYSFSQPLGSRIWIATGRARKQAGQGLDNQQVIQRTKQCLTACLMSMT